MVFGFVVGVGETELGHDSRQGQPSAESGGQDDSERLLCQYQYRCLGLSQDWFRILYIV